ncbi:MAG: hypothetical protein JOZ42_05115 [Acetobacteraceae bacterium]|nr:hypothetical protein [Acetobacteraceae bacterium]
MKLLSLALVLALALLAGPAAAQNRPTRALTGLPTPGSRSADTMAIETLNAWTVGLAGGQLEGAPIRFATEIARVVDDGDNLHVLPIVTHGPAANVESLLYLRGVDAAIINSDSLQQFEQLVPNIFQRITYILNLFPSELHIFVRPGINSLDDLKGKKVNFNTPGTTAAYSGPLIFEKLKIDVEKTFIPHQIALEQMRAGQGDIAAVVFLTSKPIDAFLRKKWDPGFKFLSVPFEDFDLYLPSTLTSSDYPGLIPEGEKVQTIAVPTILAAYNWPKGSDRYRRVARLTDYLFNRLDKLRDPAFHPAWKDVNPDAKVPGLNRFPAAQEWLDHNKVTAAADRSASADEPVPPGLHDAAHGDPAAEERLFQEFLKWKNQHH